MLLAVDGAQGFGEASCVALLRVPPQCIRVRLPERAARVPHHFVAPVDPTGEEKVFAIPETT